MPPSDEALIERTGDDGMKPLAPWRLPHIYVWFAGHIIHGASGVEKARGVARAAQEIDRVAAADDRGLRGAEVDRT